MSQNDDLLARLAKLKEMYNSTKQELTATPSDGMDTKPLSAPVASSIAPGRLVGGDSDSDAERDTKVGGRPAKRPDMNDPDQLDAVIKKIIEENGGSAMIDTIVEQVRMRMPRRRDGTLVTIMDAKRIVTNHLRMSPRFARDTDRDHFWLVAGGRRHAPAPRQFDSHMLDAVADSDYSSSDDSGGGGAAAAAAAAAAASAKSWEEELQAIASKSEVAGLIIRAMEHRQSISFDELFAFVSENLSRKPGIPALSDDDIRTAIRLQLSLHSRLFRHEPASNHYFLAPPHAKQPGSAGAGMDKRRRRGYDEDTSGGRDEQESDDERSRKGGARLPAVPGRGGMRTSPDKATGGYVPKGRQQREELANQWIQCDNCRKWVQCKNDPMIEDLSVYDDSNPNHLDYYCPKCRKRQEEETARVTHSTRGRRIATRGNRNADDDVGANTAPSKRGGKSTRGKRRASDATDEQFLTKFENLERQLLSSSPSVDPSLLVDPQRAQRPRALVQRYLEEIVAYKQSLLLTRASLLEKSQRDLEAGIAQLEREKEQLDARTDEEAGALRLATIVRYFEADRTVAVGWGQQALVNLAKMLAEYGTMSVARSQRILFYQERAPNPGHFHDSVVCRSRIHSIGRSTLVLHQQLCYQPASPSALYAAATFSAFKRSSSRSSLTAASTLPTAASSVVFADALITLVSAKNGAASPWPDAFRTTVRQTIRARAAADSDAMRLLERTVDRVPPLAAVRGADWELRLRVQESHLDPNGHVNHAVYATWAEDLVYAATNNPLGGGGAAIQQFTIEHLAELRWHDDVVTRLWRVSEAPLRTAAPGSVSHAPLTFLFEAVRVGEPIVVAARAFLSTALPHQHHQQQQPSTERAKL